MGLRTNFRGIFYAGELKAFFGRRTSGNPYTSYGSLLEQYRSGLGEEVKNNLRNKVEAGFISLEEIISNGRAARMFKEAGMFEEAVARLAAGRAVELMQKPGRLERFLLSERRIVPYVVEHLSNDEIALALCRVSMPVRQRSVINLVETARTSVRDRTSENLMITFTMDYDKEEIATQYFPGNIRSVFCFEKEPEGVRGLNRGIVITDRFVANASGILDALAKLDVSPLDHILIYLRGVQGLLYPTLPSMASSYPQPGPAEFISRDHFTEKARGALHRAVADEFERMQEEKGKPLSFRVYIRRDRDRYHVEISWKK